jgi:ElaB/YqjD/DUF883 family membrane-anchored ribosome-binding protein
MDNESEVIRHQMEETRTALQDKLETLEQQVKDTVQGATEAVTETVSTVKEAVQDTVGTVKDSVHETVESVKETFDLQHQVERHPWPMFCGAAAVGFVGSRLLDRALAVSPAAPVYPSPPAFEPSPRSYDSRFAASANEEMRETPTSRPVPSRSWWTILTEQYGDELNKVKSLAISTLGGLVGEMILQSVPPALKEEVKEVVDGVTAKLGGHRLEGSLLNTSSESSETNGGSNGSHREEESRPRGGLYREREEGAGRFDR